MRKDLLKATFVLLCFFSSVSLLNAQNVKLTEVEYHGTGCYRIEMPMGTVYFEKDNGVSGFKSFIELLAGHNVIRLVALGAQGLVNIDHFAFFSEEL
jgi:hypothetical protein